ncbi:MAG: hypothetical protein ABL998_21110 [Planctomycetota bacterium]
MNDQAEYARISALVRLRLEALQRALDEHEGSARWREHEALERVEAGLAELECEVTRS